MPLSVGDRLGHYDVTALIGEGGMGQVFRATDTKLDREVALKVLPQAFTDDPDRLVRFEREAKVLASLNHPNIAQIYGVEEGGPVHPATGAGATAPEPTLKSLVLELVEGPTLADRIAQGPIAVGDALSIARQIAEALETAHAASVIHRDLKPANIKIRDDGTVKVLDFGLAKAPSPTPQGDPSQSPTLTAAATQMGVVLGTAAYMSPEQASGEPIDERADAWSYGVVLFEMLTGQRLFTGRTVAHVMAQVLDRELDFSGLPTTTPPLVKWLLRRCLERNQKRRLSDFGEALVLIDEALTAPTEDSPPSWVAGVPAPTVLWRRTLPWMAGILLACLTGFAVWTVTPRPGQPVSRMVVSVAPSAPLVPGFSNDVAISPDGSRVVYTAGTAEQSQLHVRLVDQLQSLPLTEPGLVSDPFMSPDGAWVGFMSGSQLQRVSVLGGPPMTIVPDLSSPTRGASWGDDGTIVFAVVGPGGLSRVAAVGGQPETIATFDSGRPRWPDLLPGGIGVLFTIDASPAEGDEQIAVLDYATGEHRVIIPTGSNPKYSPTGHIVYGVDGTLYAVVFDLDTLSVMGDPVPVVEGLLAKLNGAVGLDLSETGSLAYVAGSAGPARDLRSFSGGTQGTASEGGRLFVWVDTEGNEDPLPLPAGTYAWPRVSPDGARLAVVTFDAPGNQRLRVFDIATGRGLILTQDGVATRPVWTPDGEGLVFSWSLDGSRLPYNLYRLPADGSGQIEPLTTFAADDVLIVAATGITPDGRTVIFARVPEVVSISELWSLPLDGEGQPTPLLQRNAQLSNGDISPDGNWLSYRSNEAGERDVYLQPYPDLGPIVPVSIGGGTSVIWSPDGSELYYRSDTAVMAIGVDTENGAMRIGTSQALFDGDYIVAAGGNSPEFHVAPDGRFLMMTFADAGSTAGDTPTQVVLVQNWHRELLERVTRP